jgi:DNA polymerase I/DNA polymerase-2
MDWLEVSGREAKHNFNADIALEADEIKQIKVKNYPKFDMLAFDIEMSGKEIIMISFAGSGGFNKIVSYGWPGGENIEIVENEEALIRRFIDVIRERNPDIITTYNGDRFDFLKLRERADVCKINLPIGRDGSLLEFVKRGRILSAKITGRFHVDSFDFVEHILASSLSSEILTLDEVAKEILGFGKKSLNWQEIESCWKEKKDMEKVAEYCLWDSVLAMKLCDHILPQICELSRIIGQTGFDINRMTYSQLVESLLMRNACKKNEIILNRPKYDEIQRRKNAEPYAGGYVYPPKPGIHEDIALFDFLSLYPSIIVTHNISPETLDKGDGENKTPDGDHFFTTSFKGFVPAIIENLIRKRIEVKRKMKLLDHHTVEYKYLHNRQYALKILANASYGYYAYSGSRWYSRICAKSIASWGRYYIQKVIKMAEDEGFEIIYGDTDSLFLKNMQKKNIEEFLESVNASLPETMELDFDGVYESGIFVPTKIGTPAKKRYALLDKNEKMLIRGFEKVRRDWSEIAKKTQEKVLFSVLKDKDPEKAMKIVKSAIKHIESGQVDMKDLVIYTQITKPLKDYEQVSPHVAAAKKYVEKGRAIRESSLIGYIITKGVGSISDRAEPFEYAKDYDPDYYINNQIIPAAFRVLQALGYKKEDLFDQEEQKSLEKFLRPSIGAKMRRKLKI